MEFDSEAAFAERGVEAAPELEMEQILLPGIKC
jgi:hypothetical protein